MGGELEAAVPRIDVLDAVDDLDISRAYGDFLDLFPLVGFSRRGLLLGGGLIGLAFPEAEGETAGNE
jgi:hypothetical protein